MTKEGHRKCQANIFKKKLSYFGKTPIISRYFIIYSKICFAFLCCFFDTLC